MWSDLWFMVGLCYHLAVSLLAFVHLRLLLTPVYAILGEQVRRHLRR
jgi:hypothetical protein